MATIVYFETPAGAAVAVDLTNKRLSLEPCVYIHWPPEDPGAWVDYSSTDKPIGLGAVKFNLVNRLHWIVVDLDKFVAIRQLDVVPEPELEDLVGPMRSDVIIRGAAELAASIFVQQGWADVWDPEEIETELSRLVKAGYGCLGKPPFQRLHVERGGSGKTYLSIDLDSIRPEDFETEA